MDPLPDGEPEAGPWLPTPVAELYPLLGRPRVLAVDGRQGAGKSTERGLLRDGCDAIAFWDEWEARERLFLAADRPWDRADLVVSGQDVRHELVEVGGRLSDLPAELRRLGR